MRPLLRHLLLTLATGLAFLSFAAAAAPPPG